MDSLLSFPVGLFHPLPLAGLSRRSPSRRPSGSYPRATPNTSSPLKAFEVWRGTIKKARLRCVLSKWHGGFLLL